ncbi:hypothetical protein Q9251_01710 [Alkalihalobacillus macyae]|nr:hypothetical protein [Alkalihalobacillus macyae]MDP4549594.1 hypothetical protein [Alkalihalobacillus macyae]
MVAYYIRKRKKAGITGFKSSLTAICLFLAAVINLSPKWFEFIGSLLWTISMLLIVLGTYFTKYIPNSEK